MKSIIEDALARGATDEKSESSQVSYTPDQELEEVLKTLQTNIIVIGCGGAGSNTISRMTEEGIEGVNLLRSTPMLSTSGERRRTENPDW